MCKAHSGELTFEPRNSGPNVPRTSKFTAFWRNVTTIICCSVGFNNWNRKISGFLAQETNRNWSEIRRCTLHSNEKWRQHNNSKHNTTLHNRTQHYITNITLNTLYYIPHSPRSNISYLIWWARKGGWSTRHNDNYILLHYRPGSSSLTAISSWQRDHYRHMSWLNKVVIVTITAQIPGVICSQ